MTVNIKDNCSPWELDPGKFYLMSPHSINLSAGNAFKNFYFGRNVHVTKVGVVVGSTASTFTASVGYIGAYKATTTASGVALTVKAATFTGAVKGTVVTGSETEVEFLTTDALKLCVKTAIACALPVFPFVEYEIA